VDVELEASVYSINPKKRKTSAAKPAESRQKNKKQKTKDLKLKNTKRGTGN